MNPFVPELPISALLGVAANPAPRSTPAGADGIGLCTLRWRANE